LFSHEAVTRLQTSMNSRVKPAAWSKLPHMNSPKWQLEPPPSQTVRLQEKRGRTLTLPNTRVDDVLMQIAKQVDGNHQVSDYFLLP
jgi:hypothetical protein